MKKLCAVLISCCAVTALISVVQVEPAHAYPKFFKAFTVKYVGEDDTKKSDSQKALEKEIKRVKKCAVCHDPRKDENGKVSKKNRNPYGAALNKFLTKDDKNDLDKAAKMLEKVEKLKPQDAEKTDPAFGELIQKGKLPFEYKEKEKK